MRSFFSTYLKFKGTQGKKAPVTCLLNSQHFFVECFGVFFCFSKMISKPVINNCSEGSSFKDSRTLLQRSLALKTFPRTNTFPMDTSPTRHIPDGQFPNQTNAWQIYPRPGTSPTDTFLTRKIHDRHAWQ